MIAVPVRDKGDNPQLEERFGRSDIFCLIDGAGNRKFIDNEAPASPSGAGVQTVQMLADEGVKTVISPEVGPKAMTAMTQLEIKVFHIGEAANLSELLSLYNDGKLAERTAPSHGGGLRKA
ncbi:MAG: NifB/NifX family molybdenum-iron cluster-binding protein [Spirochaetales bacterium]|nr:NifB/NifX family molybdenum-iron cluster-binding protein [Spirochaetales bacterium]